MANTLSLADKAEQVQIGDMHVNRLGLGTNRITDTNEARTLLKRAVELGVNFIDTAHTYQGGASETTIGRTLAPYPKGVLIATKGGMNGASPEQLRADLEDSLQRLKIDCIDLYQLHRVDPAIPLETTLSTMKQFQDEGKVRYIGLSEVNVKQIEQAQQIVPIVSVQNEYNLAKRQHEDVVDYCTEHGIIFIPWFPLGGLRGDTAKVNSLTEDLAKKHQATPQQIALAWLLVRSPLMLPIPGTLSIEHLVSNLQAALIELSQADYQSLYNA
ncbi:MAG TPA: aldo/keto reductase [Candidatus Saccharimonadales bacterium]|nr:aldo/keto reductase [Candidatus Saccharimonadales bacterium]